MAIIKCSECNHDVSDQAKNALIVEQTFESLMPSKRVCLLYRS